MRTRTLIPALVASAAAVALVPSTAQAASAENVQRSLFDSTPVLAVDSIQLDGPTSGPLGGAMDVTVRATDGSLPVPPGSCEEVAVEAGVTMSPGKVVALTTTGEGCAHVVDGSLRVNAYFTNRDVTFEGYPRRARLVGDGLLAVSHGWLGGQASFSGSFRW